MVQQINKNQDKGKLKNDQILKIFLDISLNYIK
jgi:hypothetical protein